MGKERPDRWARCLRGRLRALAVALACVLPVHAQECAPGQNRATRTLAGAVPLVAGGAASGLQDGTTALFSVPSGVSFSRDGTRVAVADANNSAIRLVDAGSGNTSTIARLDLASRPGSGLADGPAMILNRPLGVDYSPSGELLAIADLRNGLISILARPLGAAPGEMYTLAAGLAVNFSEPADVAFSPIDQILAVAERDKHRVHLVNISSGATTLLVGSTSMSGLVDGVATQVRFNRPSGVAFSPDGASIAVADAANNAVRLITLPSASANMTVQTLAGAVAAGFVDGVEASFSDPRGVSFSPDGTALAVADYGNNAIRMVNLTSRVTTTIAGRGPFSAQLVAQRLGDGVAPTFYRPTDVAFSPDGARIAVADSWNHAIRMVAVRCVACPSNTYKDLEGQADCSMCPSNMTSSEGSTSVSDCLCQQGYVVNGSTCSACRPGKYKSEQASSACLDCPDDTFSAAIGAISSSMCDPCPRYSLSGAGSSSIADCRCLAGYTGSEGNCSACPRGFFKAAHGSASCISCTAGKFTHTEGLTGCGLCRAGTFSARNASSCTQCSPGSYSAAAGSSNCTACQTGTASNMPGASNCTMCDVGFFSDVRSALECKPCGAGKYSNLTGSSNCSACEMGTASNFTSGTACSLCMVGTYSNVRGGISCAPCDAGKYSSAAASNCTSCPTNTFSGESSGNCTCNFGYTGADMGPCIACRPGTYKATNGSTACLLCPSGKFQGGNASSSCSSCPPFASSPKGSVHIAACMCEAGYTDAEAAQPLLPPESNSTQALNDNATAFNAVSDGNRTSDVVSNASSSTNITWASRSQLQCRACPPGTFKSTMGSDACTNCTANTYAAGASSRCTECPAFSSAPVVSKQRGDCKCNLGYRPDADECSLPICAPGQYNPDSGRADAYELQCQSCPRNSWSAPGRKGMQACQCNAGYSGRDGEACKACEVGEYKPSSGSAACILCQEDFYTERDIAADSCVKCPNNSYSFEGSFGALSCACNRGYTGPRCVVVMPQADSSSSCSTFAKRRFEVEMSMSITADSVAESGRIKAKIVKETANYFGLNSSQSESSDNAASSSSRRADLDFTVKQQVEGDQKQFAESASEQPSALTSFLQLRGLAGVQVKEIVVSCGAGFTVGNGSACIPCAVGRYKDRLDNSGCIACPESKTTKGTGATKLSACSEWAGQRLSDQTAMDVGYWLSIVVGSVVGINTVGAAVGLLSSPSGKDVLGSGDLTASALYASGSTSASSAVQGLTLPGGSGHGWGGGGGTMALLAQVQFLQILLRIGGSKGRVGLFRLADSIGWFNFEFPITFFGRSGTSQALLFSPISTPPFPWDTCGLEALAPTLDKLVWCAIVLASVAVIRLGIALLVGYVWKDVPRAMHFPIWEGRVFLAEFIAVVSSAFLAVLTSCSAWTVVGYVLLSVVPLGFILVSGIVLGRHVFAEHMVYESYDAKADPPRVPPSFAEMRKSVEGSTGIVPRAMRLREWYLAVEARGWWKDGSQNAWGLKFLVGDYVGSAWFFGLWLLAKKVLLSAATTVVDGHGGAIFCIVVQTFDTILILVFRPYVSKVTCLSECFAGLTNWFAVLFLGLLAWPGSTPLHLGEMTCVVLALTGTGLAILAASAEAVMAGLTLLYNIFAGLGACVGTCGPYVQKCCFGTPLSTKVEGDDGPIFLTSIASDWAEPQHGTDVTMNMGYPYYDPSNPGLSNPQDPAVLAAYYRQLADYHQMMSYSMKAGSDGGDPRSAMVSPVSMSTAPTTFYNADAVQTQARSLSLGWNVAKGPDNSQVTPRSETHDPKLAVTASLFRPARDSPVNTVFSRRSAAAGQHEVGYNVPINTVPPLGRGVATKGENGHEVPTLPLAHMPHQLYPFSSPRQSSSLPPPSAVSPRNGRSSPEMRWRPSPPYTSMRSHDHRDFENDHHAPPARILQQASSSPRGLPDRDSPWNLQSPNSSRSEELRDGIMARAEALRKRLSRSETPGSAQNASFSSQQARGGSAGLGRHVSPQAEGSSDGIAARGGAPDVLSDSRGASPHVVSSPMSNGRSPKQGGGGGRQQETPLRGGDANLQRLVSPLNVPPAPAYPAPPPPQPARVRPAEELHVANSDSEWETGFG